ncbi:MAG: dihydropteroate synthase, partial [Gammaproteobacteria bacterium]
VLTPLISLEPRLTVPGLGKKTLMDWSQELPHHIPLWMGILNITPDSFSDGGQYLDWKHIEPHVDEMIAAGVHIIDIGGESTRPGAQPLTDKEVWSRIGVVLKKIIKKTQGDSLRPLISVDTYHPAVARNALELGVDMINDEGGLTSPDMIALAKESGQDWVAMHQLTLPVDPTVTLNDDSPPGELIERWLIERLEHWQTAGLDLNRIIFDPGIGFGKNHLQSLEILRHAGDFRGYGLRTLIGHSRKSFMKSFLNNDEQEQDLITVGASLNLCAQGVDIIRVHDVPLHAAAYRGWAHSVGKKTKT